MLNDLYLPSRVNQTWTQSGLDCAELCLDINHYHSYGIIEYHYNSRGFRDSEWPQDIQQLSQSLWCLGDSYTVGVGSRLEHTWPWLLGKKTNQRTINVSLDGASNNWIARRARDIIESFAPKNLVIMWSFIERRELSLDRAPDHVWNIGYQAIKDPTWPDCQSIDDFPILPMAIRKELANHDLGPGLTVSNDYNKIDVTNHFDEARRIGPESRADELDLDNTKMCCDLLWPASQHTQIINMFVPRFASSLVRDHISEFARLGPFIEPFCPRDRARDGLHFDIVTADWLTDQLVPLLRLS